MYRSVRRGSDARSLLGVGRRIRKEVPRIVSIGMSTHRRR